VAARSPPLPGPVEEFKGQRCDALAGSDVLEDYGRWAG
jgi:hypothetical protein